ncbi:LuxR C-terminal-related transcriptional regulator [Streptosporangium sp. NPDC051022]|uniref:LuxR C-terminal-related transcriptional regulator n=1 Tax=Streptosporangium sp. NPDC051022 TaxID=3155752 RepID=UPI0034397DE6
MSGPLLRGKLAAPSIPGHLMSRPFLFDRLNRATERRVTVLAAPAGWGKTLLLASWLDRAGPPNPAAWLTVDHGDVDPIRLWTYLLAAVRRAVAVPDDHPLTTLRPPQTPGPDLDMFPALLVNALGELPEPLVLVLDDVHELSHQPVLQGLEFLIQHAPPQLRLVLAGRFLPSLPIARLRVAGEVAEVRTADLAFTEEEAGALFTDADLALSADQVGVLRTRTEGWPAGLRLAAISLRDRADPAGFVAEFAGDDRVVAEYLMSEVLTRLDEDILNFLLRTSVCERMTGELAHALTGREDAARLLEDMARANTFTSVQEGWYRYHQLFADTLRLELRRRALTMVPELHRRAASWYAEHGLTREALHHSLSAADWLRVSDLMGTLWLRLFLDGEIASLRGLLERVPEEVIAADAELAAIRAATRLAGDDTDGAYLDIRLAEQSAANLPPERRHRFEAAMAMARLDRAQLTGDVAASRAAAGPLLDAPPSAHGTGLVSDDVRALARLRLGITEYWTGERARAERHLREGLSLARRAGREYIALGCLSQLAGVLTAQDRPTEAVRVAGQAAELAERRGWGQTAQMAEAWHALGWVHYLHNRLDEADQYLDRAEEAVRVGESAVRGTIRLVQGLVLTLRGNPHGALSLMEMAEDDVRRVAGTHVFAPYPRGETIRLLAAVGQRDRALELLRESLKADSVPVHLLVAQAELYLADDEPRGALEALGPALRGTAPGFLDQRLQAWVLAAVAHERLGDRDEAARTLEHALKLAEPEGLRQPFLRIGDAARGLLTRHASFLTTHPRFVNELLGAFGTVETSRARTVLSAVMPEPLSQRETELLHYLGSLLTVPEMAAQLYLSVNTVKAHLKSIYRKLGVSSRRQALIRARELGIL